MAKKADFTEDEWKLLISTPRYILLALRSADRMGLLTSRGERKALDSYIEEYKTRSPLVRSIMSDQKDVSNRLRTKNPLEYIERTGKLLNNKAKGSSGQSARAFLLGSSVAIANGVRENRRRNADSITDNEQEMLDKIKEALKSTAVKRPKKPKATRTTKKATVQKSAEKPKTTTRSTSRATSRGGTSTRPRTTTTRKSPTKSTTRSTSATGPKRPTRSSKIVKPAPTRAQSAGTIRRESPMTSRPAPAPAPRQAAPAPAPRQPAPAPRQPAPAPRQPAPAPRQPAPAPRQPAPAPRQPAPAPRQPAPAPQKPTMPPPAQAYTSPAASGDPSVVRWTNIYAAPQPNTALEAGLAPGTQVSVLGRDQWGGWVLIEQGNSTGWIPRDALDLESADGLTIMDSGAPQATGSVAQAAPQQATQAAPVVEDYSAEPEVVETMTITRWTNIFSQPNAGAATDVSLAPDTRIVLLGTGDGWINIRHEETEGWIPNDALM